MLCKEAVFLVIYFVATLKKASSLTMKIIYPQSSTVKTRRAVDREIDGYEKDGFHTVLSEMDKLLGSAKHDIFQFYGLKPSFKEEGRRMSEQKCYDYIWRVKQYEAHSRYFGDQKDSTGKWKGEPGLYPHMGAVGWYDKKQPENGDTYWIFLCDSFLISERFLVTAAHCQNAPPNLDLKDYAPKIVRLGVQDIWNGKYPNDAQIKNFIPHWDYKPGMRYNDIALIEVKQPINTFKYIRPICLWGSDSLDGISIAITSGWGVVKTAPMSHNQGWKLMTGQVDLKNTDLCNMNLSRYRTHSWSGVSDHQFCATIEKGSISEACDDDSGGPVQIKLHTRTVDPVYSAIGVSSFGFGCINWRDPFVYTKISSFLPWIEETVWNVEESTEDSSIYIKQLKSERRWGTSIYLESHPVYKDSIQT